MKKILLLTVFFTLCFILSNESRAQNIGAGLAFGTEVESLGIGVNGQFATANRDLIISPSFILFFPDDPLNFWELNADVNYYFSRSSASVYGILGLNLGHTGIDGIDDSGNTELGLNLGAGVDLDLGSNIVPFAQAKYAISDFDQLVIFFGARFPIN